MFRSAAAVTATAAATVAASSAGGGGLETPGPTIVADFHDVTVGGDPDIIQRRYLEAT